MLLTAAITMTLIAVFTQSDGWYGLTALVYFIGIGVAVLGWGLPAVTSVLPVGSGWSTVLLSVVTGPLGLPVWQSVVIATLLFFVAIATWDTDTAESSEATDRSSPTSNADRIPNVEELPGVGEQKAGVLHDAGYESAADILAASKWELTDVDDIGTALASQLKTTVHERYEDRDWYESVEKPTPTTETADESTTDTSTAKAHSNREKRRAVAGLEATCDRIESLVTVGEVTEANDRLPAARATVNEIRAELTTLSSDHDLRLRVNDVEDRLSAVPSKAEVQFNAIVADGDTHVTEAQDAVETGDVDEGLEACGNAHAAYRSARQLGETANEQWFSEREAALDSRISTVELLADRFAREMEVQQAETQIDVLTQRMTSLKETANLEEAEAVMESIVEDGSDALDRLPDDITAPELVQRVAHLREQITDFETVAGHLAAQSASAKKSDDTTHIGTTVADDSQNPEAGESGHPTGTARGLDEQGTVVQTADGIEETARHPTPVVLRVREQLTEDGRRRVFRAETVDGDAVQLDVWNRHLTAFDWEPSAWYTFNNVRGQRWTVNGHSGVTVSTTPEVSIRKDDSPQDAGVRSG